MSFLDHRSKTIFVQVLQSHESGIQIQHWSG